MGFSYVLIFLALCFGVYKLYRKRNPKPLWSPDEEADLKVSIKKIFSADTVDAARSIAVIEMRKYTDYLYLLEVACEERCAEIIKKNYSSSFEQKERWVRKSLAFFLYSDLSFSRA